MKKKKIFISGGHKLELQIFEKLMKLDRLDIVGILTTSIEYKIIQGSPSSLYYSPTVLHLQGLLGQFAEDQLLHLTRQNLEKCSWAEIRFLEMMRRLDVEKLQSYPQRRLLWHFLISYWFKELSKKEVDVCYFQSTPHEVCDFALFVVAKALNIQTYMFQENSVFGLQKLVPTYFAPWNSLVTMPKQNRATVETRINEIMETKKINYDNAKPNWVLEAQKVREIKPKIFYTVYFNRIKFVFRNLINPLPSSYLAAMNSFELPKHKISFKSLLYRLFFIINYIIQGQNTKDLSTEKRLLEKKPNLKAKYVIFFLNYSPENTICPMGGDYAEQYLAIAQLAEALPNGWRLYVKEHPEQYNPSWGAYPYLGREKGIYHYIDSLKSVTLIDETYDPFVLIQNAEFVATITGTVGWEAALRDKNVIIFGETWYELAPNVYKIDSVKTLKEILKVGSINPDTENKLRVFIRKEITESLEIFLTESAAIRVGKVWDYNLNAELFEFCINKILFFKDPSILKKFKNTNGL